MRCHCWEVTNVGAFGNTDKYDSDAGPTAGFVGVQRGRRLAKQILTLTIFLPSAKYKDARKIGYEVRTGN